MLLETATRNTNCDNHCALVNGGAAKIYSATDVLLCEITLNATAFNAASNGVAAVNNSPALTGNPVANGTASYFTACNSGGTVKWSDLVGSGGDGKAMQLGSTTISIGVPVTISTWTVTVPAGSRV